ncbi:MAG: TIGR00282 family metallophosphoesterase [Oscillospiraceae bacterium]|nr:TIGR00282 family metallophosphoesterase [Oscillospiraceae bacterium]
MKLLFIGDVVGKSGCDFLQEKISGIKKEYGVDILVVNGENSAQGNGITRNSLEMLVSAGADVVTTGNHCFKRRESVDIFDEFDYLLRPVNYPDGVCGHGVCELDMGAYKIAVVNLQGVVYMDSLQNPFEAMDKVLSETDAKNIFVDFHAEATAEKKAMGHYLTGKVTALLGTHTHVQTADEIILGGHTAYITDAGMTGPELSVLGVDVEPAVNKQRFHYPVQFKESENPCFLNGVLVDFDEKLGKANKIQRIIVR